MAQSDVHIRPFADGDQVAARALILGGLGEHFGSIDPTRNPDLDDIAASYMARGAAFLVAELNGRLVGTGALVEETAVTARIVRMSVASDQRRQGIGQRLVTNLLDTARRRGYHEVLVETNDDWHDAIRLYQHVGFQPYARANGEIHMRLRLQP